MLPSEQRTGSKKPNAWQRRAGKLADWTMARLVVRTDRVAGYYVKAGDDGPQFCQTARPTKGPKPNYLDRTRLAAHFVARAVEDIVVLYMLDPEDSTGRAVVIDIDAHGDAGDDPEKNLRYALALYARAVALGFRPLLVSSNGKGGYHLWLIFDAPVDGGLLYEFGRWLVRDHRDYGFDEPPEVNPKQREITGTTKFGNGVRLPGKHYQRDHWSAVWDGSAWLADADAVEYVLGLAGDPCDLVPFDELARAAEPRAEPQPPRPAPPGADGLRPGDAYNLTFRTPEDYLPLVEPHDWKPFRRRGAASSRRPGRA